jgi:hypothetical protein
MQSKNVLETSIAGTLTALPTFTISPTDTEKPTYTITPSQTSTPIPTDTLTPLPPLTQTAIALIDQKTRVAENATATKAMLNFNKTATVELLNYKRTATSAARSSKYLIKTEYKEISWKELITYPEVHEGEKIKIKGTIFNIVSYTEFQMFLWDTDKPVYVITKSFEHLYKEDVVTVYGVVGGMKCGKNYVDNQICQISITDAFVEKK